MENKAWFWLMGTLAVQKVQPWEENSNLMFHFARNGSDMFSPCCPIGGLLGLRRKYSKQRENEVDGRNGIMCRRLRSASRPCRRIHIRPGQRHVVVPGLAAPYTAGGI